VFPVVLVEDATTPLLTDIARPDETGWLLLLLPIRPSSSSSSSSVHNITTQLSTTD
jgi:hypothetical protein